MEKGTRGFRGGAKFPGLYCGAVVRHIRAILNSRDFGGKQMAVCTDERRWRNDFLFNVVRGIGMREWMAIDLVECQRASFFFHSLLC